MTMGNDKIILDTLIEMAKGVGAHFGSDCEVVVHDLKVEDPEKTICYIENGGISGRKEGDGPSKVVLQTMRALNEGKKLDDKYCYLTRTRDGRILKSSTMYIRGLDGSYRFLFGINYDITKLVNLEEGLSSLIKVQEEEEKDDQEIPNTVNELLDSLIEQSVKLIGKQPALMTKEEKVRAIRFLNDAGAFLITKSGDRISQYFGISKFTLYSYIDINKKK